MAKEMRFVQTWGEVAPSLLLSHQKQQPLFSSSPKLETILEEGCDEFTVVAPKRIVILLPLVLSMFFYLLLYKNIIGS